MKRDKKREVAEHNAKYEVMSQRRKEAQRYVQLLKGPKVNG